MDYINVVSPNYLNQFKVRQYYIKLRFEIMDWYENVTDEITVDILSSSIGNLSVNLEQGVRRSVSFSVYDYDGRYKLSENSPFQIYKKFKLYIGLVEGDDTYYYSQGIFISKNVKYVNQVLSIEAVDKFAVFTDELKFCCLQQTYVIPVETKVDKVVKDILTLNSKKGYVYDIAPPIIDITIANDILPYEIKKESGSYIGDILIEIATSMNANIYYNTNGNLVITKNKDGQYIHLQPLFYASGDDLINLNVGNDLANCYNMFTVYGYDKLGGLHQHTAINKNAMSPCRLDLLGEKPCEIEENEMCVSDEVCIDYSNYKMKQNLLTSLSCSLSVHCSPLLDVDNTIAIADEYFGFDFVPFVIKSFSVPLGVGLTNVECTNIQWLPDYTQDIYYTNVIENSCNLKMAVTGDKFTVPRLNDFLTLSCINWGDNSITDSISMNKEHTHTYTDDKSNHDISISNIREIFETGFKDNVNIKSLKIIPYGIFENTFVCVLNPFVFMNCTSLETLTIADNVKASIGCMAFKGCVSLTTVNIGDNTEYIGEYAFAECSSLETISLTNSIKSIGMYAFDGCTAIKEINFKGSQDEWDSICFGKNAIPEPVKINFI